MDSHQVLNWYRVRWQIELIFKRFKSIAGLGHLPKYDDASSRAWLYAKLFLCLLSQKLVDCAKNFPHGDTRFKNHNSNWREFSFMLNQILQS